MSKVSLSAKDRVIFPLDFPSLQQAQPFIDALKDHVGMFKVGLALFIKEGINGLRQVQERSGLPLFVDLKFHDIPETVAQASSALMSAGLSFKFITIHTSDGERIVKAAVERLKKGTHVLGVTVLTSLSDADLKASGINQTVSSRVLALARITKRAGGVGVVCSSREVKAVKTELGPDFIAVTPGIRPSWAAIEGDDQRRIMTPREAILNGADYIVVGRPIAQAPDPAEAALKIAEEIAEVLQ
jgi:orotidine-5'-phosphate decarboxylase